MEKIHQTNKPQDEFAHDDEVWVLGDLKTTIIW